ncbi:MAG: hypothetical protein ACTSWF_03470 [Candidatus Freyarchaeota archaeon]
MHVGPARERTVEHEVEAAEEEEAEGEPPVVPVEVYGRCYEPPCEAHLVPQHVVEKKIMFKIDSQHAQNVGDDYHHNQDQNGYHHGAETRQKTLKQDSNLQHQSRRDPWGEGIVD